MSVQVIEYVSTKLFTDFPVSNAFLLIDNRILALTIFALGLLVYYFIYRKSPAGLSFISPLRTSLSQSNKKLEWLGSTLLALGAFSYSYGLTDEVFVNLAHPLNLINHGIFSLDPKTSVDGTVEPLFYLLHIFGGTRQGIIIFNFLFSFSLFLATAYLIDRYFFDSPHRVLIRNLYLLFPPIVFAVSGGFGAALVNFLFIQGLLGIKLGNRKLFYSAIALIALSRPEALAYDMVLIAIWFIYQRKIFFPLFTTLMSVSAFYLFYRYYYGHWIPTPLYFKAYPIGCPPYFFSLWKRGFGWFINIVYDTSAFTHSFFSSHHLDSIFYLFEDIWYLMVSTSILVSIIAILKVFKQMIYKRERPDTKYIFNIALLLLLPILIIYTNPPGSLGGNSRYYLVLMSLVYLSLLSSLEIIKLFKTAVQIRITKFLFIILAFFSTYLYFSAKIQLLYNRNIDASVGDFFKDLPPEFTLSTSELNTFGYFSGRSIIDLWGYTNTQISQGQIYIDGYGRRVNPYFFLQALPIIEYNSSATSKIDWSTTRKIIPKYGDRAGYDYSFGNILRRPAKARRDDSKGFVFPTEPGWLLDNLAMTIYHGNPQNLYEKYDIVFIHDTKVMFAFLLRKDYVQTFQTWASQKGLKLKNIRTTNYLPKYNLEDLKLTEKIPCECYL